MIRLALIALLPIGAIAAAAAAAAPAPDWSRAERVEIELSSFDYRPRTIRLKAGQPIVLHLVNRSGGGHDFTARAFFAAAAALRRPVPGGRIDLKGGESRDVALVPKAGRYKVKCTHAFHSTLGMTGEIVVE